MKKDTVEIFAGTGSFSKVARARGYNTLTLDNDRQHNTDIVGSMLNEHIVDALPARPAILWASPPCQGFSVAAISTHWTGGRRAYIPKSETAKRGIQLLRNTVRTIAIKKPAAWFVENPRGLMRKLIDDIFAEFGVVDVIRHTVTYCQYGDERMKPTDIWTNVKTWQPRPVCKNGDLCHVRAPRGAKTGTQGLKGAVSRSVIPAAIFEEIFDDLEAKN